jgi:hypothetical protein
MPSKKADSESSSPSMDQVQDLLRNAQLETARSVQTALAESQAATTKSVLEQLSPMLEQLLAGQKATRVQDQEAANVRQQEQEHKAAEMAMSASAAAAEAERVQAAEAARAQAAGAASAQAAEAARVQAAEVARVQAALPPRVLQADADGRLRGGQQRMAPRMAIIQRLQQNQGELSLEDINELQVVMGLGHQVGPIPSSSPLYPSAHMSAWGVGVGAKADRSAGGLFAHLQDQGMAAPSPGEAALLAIKQVFKLTGEKEAKKATKVDSFSDFHEVMRKSKVLSRESHDKDPDSFWQMHWHSQSVTHLYANWGWDTASLYHKSVMKAWEEGFLDLPSMVDTEEARRGDVAGAMHQRFFHTALQTTGAKLKDPTAKAKKKIAQCSFCHFTGHVERDCNKKKTAEAAAKAKKAGKP